MPSSGIIGLISCGGLSSRMKKDKSLLEYHGKPHRYYLYELIKPFCSNVFLSCNKNQVKGIDPAYNYIIDNPAFENHGPASGLLSAFEMCKDKAILMVGCDYPFVTENAISHLIDSREENFLAIAYKSNPGFAEPLITIYERDSYKFILERSLQNKFSLREFLETHKTKFIESENPELFLSVDTPEQFHHEIHKIRNAKHNISYQ